jgi:hypothetical protein
MTRAPAHSRPGSPEAPGWQVLAFLAVLFGACALAWALVIGVVWLAWAYTLVVGTILAALAVVTLVVVLACKRDWRPRLAAVALFCALVALVGWAVS